MRDAFAPDLHISAWVSEPTVRPARSGRSRELTMPILSYFAVVGSVLVALLFVADATLEKSGPLPFNNESVGLPKPWQPDTKGSILTATSAPEPDMASAAVGAANPPTPQSAAM